MELASKPCDGSEGIVYMEHICGIFDVNFSYLLPVDLADTHGGDLVTRFILLTHMVVVTIRMSELETLISPVTGADK